MVLLCSGIKSNGLYLITPNVSNDSIIELNNSMVTIPTKRNEPFSNLPSLWHIRLGHINLNRISRLVKEGILGDLVLQPMEVYESYLEGKMTKRPFPAKGNKTNPLLELVHTDVYEPINIILSLLELKWSLKEMVLLYVLVLNQMDYT